MADGVVLNVMTGGSTAATDDCAAAGHAQIVKLAIATDASATLIPADADGLLVNLGANNDVTVTSGTVTTVSTVTAVTTLGTVTNVVHVDDNAASLTVDNAQLSVVGTGTEAAALRVTIATDSTGVLSVDDNGGALTVDGTVTVGSITAGDNNIGNVDIVTVPADPFGLNADAASATGSISAKLRFIAATGIPVTNTVTVGSHAVTNAGTFAVQAEGKAAHGGAEPNPIPNGYITIAHGTNPTQIAAGLVTKAYASRHGIPFVIGGHPNIITSMQIITTGVTDDSTISGTIAAGTKVVVTQVQFTVDNASTVFPKIIVGFGTANTPASGAGVVASHPGVPAGGGFSRGDGSGILGVGADGAELRVTTVGTIGGIGGYLTVSYYTIES
jgi:hypothetical protein